MSGYNDPNHGTAWVKDGVVGVNPPGPGGTPATITPCEDVEMYVQGKRIASPFPVTSSDVLEITLRHSQPTVAYSVTTSKSGLEAHLTVTPVDGSEISLMDSPAVKDLILSVVRSSVPAKPSLSDAVAAIHAKGIVVDIDSQACHRACTDFQVEPILVARGEPYSPGKDAYIEFHTNLEKAVYLPFEADRVDFREAVKMPDIRAGGMIASKVSMEPGTPGRSVTGEPILPPHPKDVQLRAGKGVEIRQEGELLAAFATTSGRPQYNERSGVVSVDPFVIHRGDVDLSTGNARSSGSLLVQGQVTEGMVAESEGTLEVGGVVTEAIVTAWGSVRLRGNVFKSTVAAGKDASWVQRINRALKDLETFLDQIMGVQEQIRSGLNAETAHDGALAHFRKAVGLLLALHKEDLTSMPADVSARLLETEELIIGARPVLFERARAIIEKIAPAIIWTGEELLKGESDILVPYAQGSVLEASRDIVVTGPGALYSSLAAGRQIRVEGSPGLFRGGTARARQSIRVNQAGGHGSVVTVLEVGVNGSIHAQTVSPDTHLRVGRISYQTGTALQNVTVSMVDGRMSVNSNSGIIWV